MTIIKQAESKDIPLINKLAEEVWFHTYSRILSEEQQHYMFNMMYSPDALKQQMTEKHHVYFILFENDNPQGYISVHVYEGNILYLEKIYILPQSQGKGFGKVLLAKAEEYAKSISLDKIRLNVNRENKASNFYKHSGYEIISERDFHIGNGFYMNDYIMQKQLTSNY